MTENRDVAFSRLVDLLDTLRGPQGCPWDREQTHDSLKRYLLEESHEVFEVIDHNPEKLPEELGDVLLQVLFHAQIAAEEGRFTIDDVLESLRDKLVRRHPHVFGEQKVRDAREVEANWEELKRGERTGQPDVSLLGSVPQAMPALAHSQLVQERAARSGFDWEQIDGVLDKVAEEVREITGSAVSRREGKGAGRPALLDGQRGKMDGHPVGGRSATSRRPLSQSLLGDGTPRRRTEPRLHRPLPGRKGSAMEPGQGSQKEG